MEPATRVVILAGLSLVAMALVVWWAATPPPESVQLAAPAMPVQPAGDAPFPPARAPLLARQPAMLPAALPSPGRNQEIARLGARPPRHADPRRQAFIEAPDLAHFALERIPEALAGDGTSQYLVYLALEQCRTYLRLDADAARDLRERVLGAGSELTAAERQEWETDFRRCSGFIGGDWSAVGDALDLDKPGAETEYASIWFERAVHGGHPAALAEQALRPGPLGGHERRDMLERALVADDPDVYWFLFAHSGDVNTGQVNVPALAWLLVACRAGQDCTESARWYRNFACAAAGGTCPPGLSAVEYYWYAAPDWERDQAWQLAREIEDHLVVRHWEDLPLPELDFRDTRRLEPVEIRRRQPQQ
jgi:hypothetical protein